MIRGHGDDTYSYSNIRHNFSSNIVCRRDLTGLYGFLKGRMPAVVGSYPEPDAASLTREWAESMGTAADSLLVTNGATEAIYLIARVYRESSSVIYVPTFSEYADACRMNGHKITRAYSEEGLKTPEGGLCWLCNPNNPTGTVWDHERLTRLIEDNPRCLFVVDQSYAPYTEKRVLEVNWASARSNVLLLHSMTKLYGVPGLRIGGVTGCPALIRQLKLFMMPWSVNAMAIEAGRYLVAEGGAPAIDAAGLTEECRRVSGAFAATGAIEVWPSDSNMLLARLRMGKAAALKEWLARGKGMLIRDASNFDGLDEGCFRIAVQRPEENDMLVENIKEWIFRM